MAGDFSGDRNERLVRVGSCCMVTVFCSISCKLGLSCSVNQASSYVQILRPRTCVRKMKRIRHEPSSLPELPNDVWRVIVHESGDAEAFFERLNHFNGAIIRGQEDTAVSERETAMLRAIGTLRLVNKLFAKTLLAVQLCGAFSFSLRQLRVASKRMHQAMLDGVTDDLGDDFDRNDVDSMANLTLKAGTVMGIGRGMLHMGSLFHRTGTRLLCERKHNQLKGLIETMRLAKADEERAYVNIPTFSWNEN